MLVPVWKYNLDAYPVRYKNNLTIAFVEPERTQ